MKQIKKKSVSIPLSKVTASKKDGGHPKRQHYVPECLLKRFTISGTDTIWFYDKKLQKSGCAAVHSIASKQGFYDLTVDGVLFSLEAGFSEIEGQANAIVGEIIDRKAINWLSDHDRKTIADYLVIQMQRTTAHQTKIHRIFKQLDSMLRAKGIDPSSQIKGYEPPTKERINKLFLRQLSDNRISSDHFFNKDWTLFETDTDFPFFTSDHPLAVQNTMSYFSGKKHGNLGLASPYVEFYFPISPTLCLGFYAKEYSRDIEAGLEKIDLIEKLIPRDAQEAAKFRNQLKPFLDNLRSGFAHKIDRQVVININSLLCLHCERQVFSYIENFQLPIAMQSVGDLDEEPL